MARVGLVVPVLNNFEGLADLLSSIRTKHVITPYLMPQYRHQEALAAAWNHGIRRAFSEGCDYALVVNDDIIFAPQCIDNMVAEYERLRPEQVIMVTANNLMGQMTDKWQILDYYLPDEPISVSNHPNFSCFMVAPEFFDLVGTFDEKFYPAWYEDNDMHYRIVLSGHRAVCSTACPSVHVGSVTTHKLTERPMSQSEHHYAEKWGSKNRSLNEAYIHPYNDKTKDWRFW